MNQKIVIKSPHPSFSKGGDWFGIWLYFMNSGWDLQDRREIGKKSLLLF
jgi:hypothetical protein